MGTMLVLCNYGDIATAKYESYRKFTESRLVNFHKYDAFTLAIRIGRSANFSGIRIFTVVVLF